MPAIRKVYKSGTATVVNIPEIMRDLCDLPQGASARLDCYTPNSLLREFGVAPSIIDQLVLQEEHFIIVRRHRE